jgi:predicted MFS family arabinose efflux permease
MAATESVAAPARDGDRLYAHRRLVGALAVTQTVGYGTMLYAFAVLLTAVAADLHTSTAAVTGALTVCVLTSALTAIPVGRWLDRHGGRGVMTAGSILGTAALLAWSQAQSLPQLYGAFVLLGVASASVLYEAAFAVVVATVPATARAPAMLAVTIVAGFAASIFLPLTGYLLGHLGWRHTLIALAIAYAASAIPLHALTVPGGAAPHAATGDRRAEVRAIRRAAWADPGFWLFAAAFTAQSTALAVISVHLVSYLVRLGHPPGFAASVAGLLGVLSVTGRIVTTALRRKWSTAAVTATVFALQAAALVAMPAIGRSGLGAAACVTAFGIGYGVATIARPAMLAERFGTTAYASIAGALAVPVTIAKAGAPLIAAVVAVHAGYGAVMIAAACACVLAASGLMLGARINR